MRQAKARREFRLPASLDRFIREFAKRKNKSVTQIIIDYLTELKKQEEAGNVPQL